jgi:hypothetical protein
MDGARRYGKRLLALGVVKVKALGRPRRVNTGLTYVSARQRVGQLTVCPQI